MDLMIFFPFIIFFSVFLYNYRYRGLDIFTYLILLYTSCSFFSIFLDSLNLYRDFDIFKSSLGIIAPLSYCGLLLICMKPFKSFNSNSIIKIESVNIKRYKTVIYIYFALFVLMLLVSSTKINEILQAQTMAALRDDFYHGNAESVWSSYSGWFRYFVAIMSLLSATSYLLILFFFYNIVVLKTSLRFNIITLIGSLTPLIQSVFIADRSGFIYWLLIFMVSFVLFRKMMTKKDKKIFGIFRLIIITVLLLYFITVTVSRFGEDTGGTIRDVYYSLVYYTGSNYIQFCNFFNHLPLESPTSLTPIFPLTYWILGLPGYFEQCEVVEKVYHHGVSNFSTFLGLILSMGGRIVMCLFVVVYYNIAMKVVKRNDPQILSVKKLIYFFIVVLVVNNGLFGYFYMSYSSTCNIIIWIFLASYLTDKNNSRRYKTI